MIPGPGRRTPSQISVDDRHPRSRSPDLHPRSRSPADCPSRNPLPPETELDKDGEPLRLATSSSRKNRRGTPLPASLFPAIPTTSTTMPPRTLQMHHRIPKMTNKPPRTPKIQLKIPTPSPKANRPRPRIHHASASAVRVKTLRIPNDVDEL